MNVRQLGLAILAALVLQTTIAWLGGSARVNVDLPLVWWWFSRRLTADR